MNWYYALNGSQQGPVSEQELSRLMTAGTLTSSTLVWREGLEDWQALSLALPSVVVSGDAPQIGGVAVSAVNKDLYVQQMREGVVPTIGGSLNYGGFWIRAVARIIDGLVAMIVLILIMGVAAGVLAALGVEMKMPETGSDAPPSPGFIALMAVYYLVALAFPILYDWYFISKHGATWGKMAMGLKVVNEDGSKVSNGKAVGRAFAYIINGFTCMIGLFIAGFDTEKRALHDHICSTRVIKTN
jgi:uncharacterized RDD family membrane protein YckC